MKNPDDLADEHFSNAALSLVFLFISNHVDIDVRKGWKQNFQISYQLPFSMNLTHAIKINKLK